MPFFLILLFSLSAFAQKNILVLGGGGEPSGNTTIFDDGVKRLGKYFEKNTDWNVAVSFNGGHRDTERYISEGLGKKSSDTTSFTEAHFNRLISEYEEKIKSGAIKPGEQLLVFISTHGAQKMTNESTHSISTSGQAATDLNTLAGASLVSMDKLKSLADLAASKGVKLGIVDSSCHSGSSLALKNANTCVITASGPNHFGYSSFGDSFASNMRKGKSLEEVFMDTFTDRDETAFPMISTAAGMKLQDDLYPLLTPYLYSYNPEHDKLKAFLEKQVMENKCEIAEENYQRILQLSNDMEKTLNGKKSDFNRLREAITDYHQYQSKIRNDLKAMNIGALSQKEKFCTTLTMPDNKQTIGCEEFSIQQIVGMNVDAELARFQTMKTTKPETASWIDHTISNFQKIKARKAELMAANPEYQRYQDYYQKEVPKFQTESWDKAIVVSKALQRLYERSYDSLSKNDSSPNPCRDFVL